MTSELHSMLSAFQANPTELCFLLELVALLDVSRFATERREHHFEGIAGILVSLLTRATEENVLQRAAAGIGALLPNDAIDPGHEEGQVTKELRLSFDRCVESVSSRTLEELRKLLDASESQRGEIAAELSVWLLRMTSILQGVPWTLFEGYMGSLTSVLTLYSAHKLRHPLVVVRSVMCGFALLMNDLLRASRELDTDIPEKPACGRVASALETWIDSLCGALEVSDENVIRESILRALCDLYGVFRTPRKLTESCLSGIRGSILSEVKQQIMMSAFESFMVETIRESSVGR